MKVSACILLAFGVLLVGADVGENLSQDLERTRRDAEWLFGNEYENSPIERHDYEEDEADDESDDANPDVSGRDSEGENDEYMTEGEDGRPHGLAMQRFRPFPWIQENRHGHDSRDFHDKDQMKDHRRGHGENGLKDHKPKFGRNPYAEIMRQQLRHNEHKTIDDLRRHSLLEGHKPNSPRDPHRLRALPQRWDKVMRGRLDRGDGHLGLENGFHGDRFYRGPPAEHYRHKLPSRYNDDHRNNIFSKPPYHERFQVDPHAQVHSRNPYREEHHRQGQSSWRYNRENHWRRDDHDNSERHHKQSEEKSMPLTDPTDKCPILATFGSCDFYHCFEAKHSCPSETNFILNVALQLCKKTDQKIAEFSDKGKEYIGRVRHCHMKNLLPVYERNHVPCEHINKFGMGILTPATSLDCFSQGDLFCGFISDPTNAEALFHVYGGTGIVEYRLLMHFARIIETCDDQTKNVFTNNYAKRFLLDMQATGLSFRNVSQMADLDRNIEAMLQKARTHIKEEHRNSDQKHERWDDHRAPDGHGRFFENRHNRHEMFERHNLPHSRSPFAQKLIENRFAHRGISPLRKFQHFKEFRNGRNPFGLHEVDKIHNLQNVPKIVNPHALNFIRNRQPFNKAHQIIESIQRARQIPLLQREHLKPIPSLEILQKAHQINPFSRHGSPFLQNRFLNLGSRRRFEMASGHVNQGRSVFLGGGRLRSPFGMSPAVHEINPQHSDVLNIRKQQAGQIVNIRNLNEEEHLLPRHNIRHEEGRPPFPGRRESKSPYALQRHQPPGLVLVPLMRGL